MRQTWTAHRGNYELSAHAPQLNKVRVHGFQQNPIVMRGTTQRSGTTSDKATRKEVLTQVSTGGACWTLEMTTRTVEWAGRLADWSIALDGRTLDGRLETRDRIRHGFALFAASLS